jgi:proprotein convertase subtilisin/kexin type 5
VQTGNSQSSSLTTITIFLEPAACNPCTLGLVVVNGICSCPDGYFPQLTAGNVTCLPCQQQFCTTCYVVPSKCTGCLYGRILDIGTGLCNCPTGQISTPSGPCITCNYACANCDSITTCLSCQSTSGGNPTFRISTPIQGVCGCQSGYYDDGASPICKKCSVTCSTCQLVNSQPSCTSCVSGANTVLSNSICQCLPNFTPNPIGDGTCVACDISCLTCRGPYTGDVADPGAGACACLSGLSETNPRSPDCVVLSCASVNPGCINCNVLTCTACSTIQNFKATPSALTGQCVCQDGYYLNPTTNTCNPCGASCTICNNATTCTTCYLGATASGGICSCPLTTYPSQTTSQCLNCTAVGCISCAGNVCSSCSTPRLLTSIATCACPDQTYDSNGQCINCPSNCRLCNSTGCIVCTNGQFLYNGVCGSCPTSFIGANGVCVSCAQNCLTCSQPASCSVCNSSYYLYLGLCLPNCPNSTLTNTNSMTCIDCVAPCASCSNLTTNCTSCIAGLGNLFNGVCGACPSGTAPTTTGCQICNTPCITCFSSPSVCSSCPANMYLYQGSCLLFCPSGTFYSVVGR